MDKSIHVAIDLDDTLNHFLDTLLKFKQTVYKSPITMEHHKMCIPYHETWQMTREEANNITNHFYESTYFLNLDSIPEAKQVLSTLKKTGYFKFYIVTARGESLKQMTLAWLQKHFFQDGKPLYDGIEFCNTWGHLGGNPREKHDVCKSLNCEFIIDDNTRHLEKCLSHGIQVALFDYNKTYAWCKDNTSHLNPLHSWKEIQTWLMNKVTV